MKRFRGFLGALLAKTLTGTSGYYKAYLTNNNSSVSISSTDSSYVNVD